MNVPEVVTRYFAAWNAHDAAAIVATFAPDGTYEDTATGGPLRGDAIGAYAAGLWSGLPDVRFDIVSEHAIPGGASAQWMMRGTNTASMRGMPPTGKSVALPGADFITVSDTGITSVRGYFDTMAMPRQLGLNVIAQPFELGPVSFGTSVHVPTKALTKPGAFSITMLHTRNAEEVEQVREFSRKVAVELPNADGFLGFTGATVGGQMFTFTAWESPEHPRKMMREGTHKDAMPAFFKHLSTGGWTSVWTPEHINPYWVRCASCGQMENSEKTSCRCGAQLPAARPYF